MDFSTKKEVGLDKDSVNYNLLGRWDNLADQVSYEGEDENVCQKMHHCDLRAWEEGTTPNSEENVEDNSTFFNFQKSSIEQHRPPFPDFQFEILNNEADTDGSGSELYLATGTRKKPPSRVDSWEDNWLFQQRKPITRGVTCSSNTLVSTNTHQTKDEITDPVVDNNVEDNSNTSESSEEQKWDAVRRVQRPCLQTSSSSSDSGDSESISSDSPTENDVSQDIEFDDKIPILDANHTTHESPDTAKANEQTQEIDGIDDSEDEESIEPKNEEKAEIDNSSEESSSEIKNQAEGFSSGVFKTQSQVEVMSDDSIKNEVIKCNGEKASHSRSGNPLPPILMARHTHSSRPVSGTKSCASEDSSSDEFEKRAAAYKPRRRASWCYLEKPMVLKKQVKRRPPLQPPRVDEDEQEIEIKVNHEEALVGLERQMLRRDVHHSSFRAKKATPNFVLNPLYLPDGDAAQNQRRDPVVEPAEMHQLRVSRYESGYSSCSPDSIMNQQNNCHVPQGEQSSGVGARLNNLGPMHVTRQNISAGQDLAESDPSFLW